MSNPNIASRFDEIYDSTNRAILAFITAKCKYTSDICDLFQETYMELYQVLSKRGVDYITNEKALVMRIAKRKIARYYSFLERLQNFVSINVQHYELNSYEAFDLDVDAFIIEDFSIKQDTLETAKQYIQSKPEDVQKIFYLRYDTDMSIFEIAQTLKMNESNVKNKLYRTLNELRNVLK